jgi:hypothetical protein
MNLLDLGFTQAYRRTAQRLADSFQAAKNAAIARRYMKIKDARQSAAVSFDYWMRRGFTKSIR